MNIKQRLLSNIEKDSETGCWNWTRASCSRGYGCIRINKVLYRTHRVAYEVFTGEIPEDKNVCHRCDNPSCLNPDHLFLGTQQDNVTDMVQKNRHQHGGTNGMAKLTDDDVREVKRLLDSGECQSGIAKRYGVTRGAIGHINQGTRWRHIA